MNDRNRYILENEEIEDPEEDEVEEAPHLLISMWVTFASPASLSNGISGQYQKGWHLLKSSGSLYAVRQVHYDVETLARCSALLSLKINAVSD